MKFILFVFINVLAFHSHAVSPEDFLKMDDSAKIDFIENHLHEIEDPKAIQNFVVTQSKIFEAVQKAGSRAADIWSDTILEGPYALDGETTTSVTTLYTLNGVIYAVYAVVSAPALMIDGCEFDESTNTWGDDCTEGSISETIIIDWEGNLIENGFYPEFD